MRGQRADVKKVLASVHKMNMGGNVVALDGDESHVQNKETSEKTWIKYEQGQCIMYVWAPAGEVAKETEKVLKGNRFAMLAMQGEVHQASNRWF